MSTTRLALCECSRLTRAMGPSLRVVRTRQWPDRDPSFGIAIAVPNGRAVSGVG